MDVDTALAEVPVNIFPLTDDTDFKSIEGAVAYNAAGMTLRWHFVTCAGAYSVTSVTPTTGGNYDWTDQGDSGIYTIEIPASGGASINNDTEGFGWFTGSATGILPWRGPVIGFRRAALNDLLIEGGTASTNLEDFFDGTGYAGGTTPLNVNVSSISNNAITAASIATGAIAAIADAVWDEATSGHTSAGTFGEQCATDIDAILTDTAEIGAAGAGLTAIPWNSSWDAEVQSEVFDALDAAFTDATGLTSNGLLDRIRTLGWILRNKIEVTDANGNTVIYKDDSTTAAFTVSSMLTDDSTTTTRLRAA